VSLFLINRYIKLVTSPVVGATLSVKVARIFDGPKLALVWFFEKEHTCCYCFFGRFVVEYVLTARGGAK
jgi:hypothetical protein